MEENQTSSKVDYTFQLEPVSSGSGEAVAEGEPAGKRTNYGGITCRVPQCYNNNKRNKDLSFYVIPNKKIYPELRKNGLMPSVGRISTIARNTTEFVPCILLVGKRHTRTIYLQSYQNS